MNWDATAAIGELTAALGVIISLVYLAVQIRQNTASMRAENLREIVNAISTSMDRLTANPDDRALYLRGRASLASLTPEERERFWVLVAGLLANCELIRDLHRDRMVKVGTYEASVTYLGVIFSNPGVREIWEERKSMFATDFQAFVDCQVDTRPPAA